ncbi:PhoU domain-containing protein [Mycoplasma marinum]|uniref:PhoU domain-containing protein n=1 Tax=Mycoplasma marinum TaxID=1937190 RepID=A0A4R0XTD5_9MOLU|nr:PhoU domain-containing protein [Mycoplasma marinum]TCG11743.1 hypothetical protein C4B24_01160 [Mycoplasma marinum]
MNEHIINTSTNELKTLLNELVGIVIEMNYQSKKAISLMSTKKAMKVFDLRNEFDKKFSILESEIIFSLTKKPLAIELRRTISYLMIAKELKSISNHSRKIAKFTIISEDKISPSSQSRIRNVHKPFREMLDRLYDVINLEEKDFILETANMDDVIDDRTNKIRKSIIQSVTNKTDKKLINERIYVLNVVNSLERAADHIVDICENILYILTNKRIKL